MKRLIAVTGGIGSGKSMVSSIIRAIGYPVYDCDSEAKALMDKDYAIKRAIADQIGSQCITGDNNIDRTALASTVFNSPEKLAKLNAIAHGAVKRHLYSWYSNPSMLTTCFVETAILYQSGLDSIVDEVWQVNAPTSLRIDRVMHRNGLTHDQVAARIASQDSYKPSSIHQSTHFIINDGTTAVLPQIEQLLNSMASHTNH